MDVTVLGPQRRTAAARAAVAELIPDGPIATVNAGWQERERDTGELGDVLQGRMRNLELFTRWQRVLGTDSAVAEADRLLSARLARQQRLYTLRLRHELEVIEAIRRREEDVPAREDALEDALRVVRELDDWHLRAVQQHRTDFYLEVRLGERPSILAERAAVAQLAADCSGFVLTGGHVGVLLHLLHVFDAARLVKAPVIAWSAGAMAISDRVVLFHDFAASGRLDPQFWAEGLGLFSSVLPFPHARRRLDLTDHDRLDMVARRFAPRECLLLPDGERVDLADARPLGPGARTLRSLTTDARPHLDPTRPQPTRLEGR